MKIQEKCSNCGRSVFGKDSAKHTYVKRISPTRYNIHCKCGKKLTTVPVHG